MLWRLIKFLFYLVVIGGICLIAYAYVGPVFFPEDFEPPQDEIRMPVDLEPDE